MNRTRLDSSFVALAAAQSEYDAALKRLAAASDAAQIRAATDAVSQARLQLQAARTHVDLDRLGELATFETSDALLGTIAGSQVLALFPAGVEARLEPGRLRIRVWPDAISTSTHDPRLADEEVAATKRYWRAEAVAKNEEESRAAWQELAEHIGATRAAWCVRALMPANLDALAPGSEPEFPPVALQDEQAPFVPRANVLPDRWIAIGIRDGARVVQQVGAPIPLDLAVGLDTTPSEIAALSNQEGEPIQLPPRMRWMTDFATAVQAGMALDVPLAANIDRIDELLIFGVRVTQTPAQNSDTIGDLFTGHRFSRGLAFVPQDTPTNNSVAGGSGLPSPGERIDTAFHVERRPRRFAPSLDANGVAAATAFGIPLDVWAPLPHSGATPDVTAEPEGFEPAAAAAMQTVLWQVTIGATLEDFLLLPEARAESLREFFRHHVRGAGPVPAIRVGRQPYGVLPVTTIDGFVAAPDEGIDPRLAPLLRAGRTWFLMQRQSAVFEGTLEGALRQLGRSTKLFAETTHQNSMAPGDNRWKSLAGTLARSSRNSIQDTWRNGRVRGTVEGIPQPVARPVVDDSTVAEIAALANALPAALLDSQVPASVTGRVVRHAALLEWSRFARGVCEATLDVPSLEDLSTRAMLGGSDVYLDVLVHAMTTPSSGPGGPVVGPVRPPVAGGSHGPIGPAAPGTLPTLSGRLSRAGRINDNEPPGPPEPPEPPVPPEPPRPPAQPGEVAVTAAELQKIRAMVGSLSQPLASCRGAARLQSFHEALARLAQFPAAQLEAEMFRTLDVSNHRLDAWFTAFASRRLATVRAANPRGVVIGGWGCLLDVRRADPANPQQRAEFIHTPSLDQAAAAAVLRSGARRAHGAGSNHADIDLSSRRVRLARWILEGVRNGRSLSDLLGARFERTVKGTPGEAQLGDLRARFPGLGGRGVLDGLRLHTERPPSTDPDVDRGLSAVDDTVDAIADVLTAEAVYQIVKGNPVGALLDLEALAGGASPPQLRVTETPPSGLRLTHRVAVIMPAHAAAPGWQPRVSPRSRAEPLLDAWCGCVLGAPQATVLTIESLAGATMTVTLSDLGVGAIDIVLGGRNRGSELVDYVIRAATARQPALAEPRVRADRSWTGLVGLCEVTARVVTCGEVLRADAFEPPAAMPAPSDTDFGDLPQRVTAAVTELASARDALIARQDVSGAVLTAAAFGIRVPGIPLGADPAADQQDALRAAIESRLAAAHTGTPRDRLRGIFGGDLPGVVTFTARDPEALVTTATPSPASLLADDPVAPAAWLDAVGRAHPRAAAVADVLLRRELSISAAPAPLLIAQVPWKDGDRWLATAFTSVSGQPPAGRLSVLMHAPAGFTATGALGGLLVDAWTDTIPEPTRDTAMALRFNNASTRAPQTILLAVSPNPAQSWTTDTLVDVLRQTLVLTRLRMQPATSFSRGGLMPFAWLGQRPGNTGISFTL